MNKDCKETPEITPSLGQALKDARLGASMSIEVVAGHLHLSVSTVRDIEDHLVQVQEERKYPVIYLRGYLSNYAKLVELDEIEQFDEYMRLVAVPNRKQAPLVSGLIPPTKKRSKWLPISFFAVLIIVVVGYQFQQQLSTAVDQVAPFSESDAEAEQASPSNAALKVPKRILPVLKSTQPTTENVLNSTSTEQPLVEAPAVDTTLESEVEVATQDNVLTPLAETPVVVERVQEAITTVTADEPLEVQQNTHTLSLSFNAECWTEVYDATGKRIAYGLYKDGRVLKLSGIAPFKLNLGDPSVVDIQYQDQSIEGDFTPGRSAKFSVPLS